MLTYTYDPAFIDYNYPNLISLLPKISRKYSIKTGTTDTDNWIIGYNADFVLGIWSGYDDNRNMENEDTHVHRNVWIDTVENYFKDKTSKWYTMPNNVVGVMVNPLTGEISKDEDKNKKIFYFIKGTEPHNNSTYDLESVFQEENSENEKKELFCYSYFFIVNTIQYSVSLLYSWYKTFGSFNSFSTLFTLSMLLSDCKI